MNSLVSRVFVFCLLSVATGITVPDRPVSSISRDAATNNQAPVPGWIRLNRLFGINIWQDYYLWDDAVASAAERMQLPEESRTSSQASYRSYPGSQSSVLGARPYSMALYGKSGVVSRISIVFANKGDIEGLAPGTSIGERTVSSQVRKDAFKQYKRWIRRDARHIEETLSSLLGPARSDSFGQGSNQTTERVRRWDVKNHSILLASPRDEYVALRIVPDRLADSEGKRDRISDMNLMKQLAGRVKRRPNGDVVISDIPMVNQGPKGYCAPATWERYLRYVGIPADMYVLAMAGNTKAGGGTYMQELIDNAEQLVQSYGRRMKRISKPAKIRFISSYIDKGLPLMWLMKINKDFYTAIDARTAERKHVENWDTWAQSLKPFRREARNIPLDDAGSHICMIIGYNKKTGEIATSDSWGPQYRERWMTEEEVLALSIDEMLLISW
jgi:hypothetical protein